MRPCEIMLRCRLPKGISCSGRAGWPKPGCSSNVPPPSLATHVRRRSCSAGQGPAPAESAGICALLGATLRHNCRLENHEPRTRASNGRIRTTRGPEHRKEPFPILVVERVSISVPERRTARVALVQSTSGPTGNLGEVCSPVPECAGDWPLESERGPGSLPDFLSAKFAGFRTGRRENSADRVCVVLRWDPSLVA